MANRHVVITGASTGIGRATALHLDHLGYSVWAGVRRAEDGDALLREGSDRLRALRLDVTDSASLTSAAAEVGAAAGDAGLAGLFNNAGIALGGPLEFIDIENVRRQLEVNVTGQIAATQAFLPLIRRATGRIVFTGSIGGKMALPFIAPYAASKHAIEAVADSLRRELRPWGIHVALLEPGSIATDIWDKGAEETAKVKAALPPEGRERYGATLDAMDGAVAKVVGDALPAVAVAKVVEHALTARKPRTRYLIGRQAKMQALLVRLAPDRAVDAIIARQLK